eukprot:359921-Amphidinium_carterae.2
MRRWSEAGSGWGEKGSSSSGPVGNPKKISTATLAVSHGGKIVELTVRYEGTGRVVPIVFHMACMSTWAPATGGAMLLC